MVRYMLTTRRMSGLDLALKYMKKFDYFVPCYYDFVKTRNETINVSPLEDIDGRQQALRGIVPEEGEGGEPEDKNST